MFDLLPPNATSQERALSLATARMTTSYGVPLRDLWNPNTAPAELLPWLAWAYSVDDWNSNWTDEQKRRAIANSVNVHRYKGTIGAVREALAALGIEIRLTEWFNQVPAGDPYTFDITLDAQNVAIDKSTVAAILPLINATKNLRSHLGTITPGASTRPILYLGTATGVGTDTTVSSGYDDAGLELLMVAEAEGFAATELALDRLHTLLNVTMPKNNYW